jgi:glyoxylase-like metal-dependent hydrolase (beta-lactamase superfamily II)/AcrR family transcriptional regulator
MARHTGTRRRVLDAAAKLFQQQGYAGTGLNQVLAESSSPKGSLYFHFPGGKEQLAAESVTLSGTRMGEHMAAIVLAAEDPASALSGLVGLFAASLDGSGFRSGCPVATVALEAAPGSETIRSSCDAVYGLWTEGLSRALRRWGVPEEDAFPLAELVISAIQGGILLAKVRRDTAVLHSIARQLTCHVSQSIHAGRQLLMRVHHLNCGSMREIDPVGGPGRPLPPARVVCHCLLAETDSCGLVLVETGLGTNDVLRPADTLGAEWVTIAEPVLDLGETALHQLRTLGHAPTDVRHIVLTHLDRDHAGGLADFPHATVHVLQAEYEAAVVATAGRYRAAQLAHGPRWATYASHHGDPWFGFDAVRDLDGLPADILLIPLGGHSKGHSAVAVNTGKRWLLHAGDAYFYHREVQPDAYRSHPLLDFVQLGAEVDRPLRLGNQARLRELARLHGDQVEVFSAHDPWEFHRYQHCDSR